MKQNKIIPPLSTPQELYLYQKYFGSKPWQPFMYITDEQYKRVDYFSYEIETCVRATTRAIDRMMENRA